MPTVVAAAHSTCSFSSRIRSGHDPPFHKGPIHLTTVGVYSFMSCYCTIIINLVQWSIYRPFAVTQFKITNQVTTKKKRFLLGGYFSSLQDQAAKKSYLDKLSIIGGLDPYETERN